MACLSGTKSRGPGYCNLFPAIVRTESDVALRKQTHAGAGALPFTSDFSVQVGDELIVESITALFIPVLVM